ncbi:MAG TPA: MAPEG family protein, partial [Xanthobacteraceae bacterium]|nr:MAPEG family protein [Xanthobacteraceae bacterium]
MTHELFWLVLTIIMTGLLWVPYMIDRVLVRGLEATVD